MKAVGITFFLFLAIQGSFSNRIFIDNYESSNTEWYSLQFFEKILNLQTVDATGGGTSCAACAVIVGLIDQISFVNSKSVAQVLDEVCGYLPSDLQPECNVLVITFGPALIEILDMGASPDEACLELNVCTNDTCILYQQPTKSNFRSTTKEYGTIYQKLKRPNIPSIIWPWDRVADHKPAFDIDSDLFSNYEYLRGYDWRGGDCNDHDETIYAGRKLTQYPAKIDHNCNGISGLAANGTSYEELLCSGTPQYGTIILGDSAAAHFHIPPTWFNASEINEYVYRDLLRIAENELDWPMMSAATGFNTSSLIGAPVGPMDSTYLRTWQANHCSFRDYQNIAVNGARSSSMMNSIMQTMARNQSYDQPVLLTYALIGNDVCNGHHDISHMTTPQEFYQNVVGAMKYLDEVLPAGSRVFFVGLVDGRILYDTMSERIHPIGSTYNNVRYKDFYNYLNCLNISPCYGWMNSDEWWRNATTQRAVELNQVYKEIIANNTFKNFDMHYFDCPLEQVVAEWVANGGQAWQLIEPVDGFHPSQTADALSVGVLWDLLEEQGLLPPVNPMNGLIEKLFGNQGGYAPSQ